MGGELDVCLLRIYFILGHPPELGMSVHLKFVLLEKHVILKSCNKNKKVFMLS